MKALGLSILLVLFGPNLVVPACACMYVYFCLRLYRSHAGKESVLRLVCFTPGPIRLGSDDSAMASAGERRSGADDDPLDSPFDIDVTTSDIHSFAKNNCSKLKGEENVFVPHSKETYKNKNEWLKKIEIGEEDKRQREKVLMVVGQTGAGKSTLINAFFNLILGVEADDSIRFKLIVEKPDNPAKSITRDITAYTIHHQPWFKIPYTVTIIDTPGFGDTSGMERDREIQRQIKAFFEARWPKGVDVLNAIGFVVKENEPKFGPTQSYIFREVFSLFGADLKDNIFIFATHADFTKKSPAVKAALRAADAVYKKIFRFDFGNLFGDKDGEDDGDNKDEDEDDDDDVDDEEDDKDEVRMKWRKFLWKHGSNSYEAFLKELDLTDAKSLWMTRENLRIRDHLEHALQNIQESITMGLDELDKLEKEKEVLEKCKDAMEENKEFEYETTEQYLKEEQLSAGYTAINCRQCNISCLVTRYPWIDNDLKECWLFRETRRRCQGFCNRCINGCAWSEHRTSRSAMRIKTRTVVKTLDELWKKYEEAEGKKMNAEQMIQQCVAHQPSQRLHQYLEQGSPET